MVKINQQVQILYQFRHLGQAQSNRYGVAKFLPLDSSKEFVSALRVDMKSGYVIDLGLMEYGKVWDLQLQLVEQRRKQVVPDVLLLCEHPHVITVGRRQTGHANILSNRFPIYEVERGGDATYHGPGQLVGYPIVLLDAEEQDPHRFLRLLEQAICQVCQDVSVPATTKEKYTGVWTQDGARKLASLGVAMRNGITFHGFALNVTTQLSCFSELNPCGLSSQVMTSLVKEKNSPGSVSVSSISPHVVKRVGEALHRDFHPMPLSTLASALSL